MLGVLLPTASAAANASHGESSSRYFPEPVFVALQNYGAIEVLPRQTVYHGFPEAHYVSLSPNGNTLIISGFKTGQVYIADAHTGKKLATLHIGKVVQGVKIDPLGKVALAVDASGGQVDVINLSTDKVTKSIPVGDNPHNIHFSKSGRLAYVTVQGDNTLAVVDMVTLKKVKTIPVTGLRGPHNLDLSADGRRLWIRSHPPKPGDTGHVVMMNLATGKVIRSLAVGRFHGGIDLVRSSPYVLTTNIGGDTVDVIDHNALAVITKIKVGRGPHGVRMSPNGRWAYVTATAANEVDVIDMHTLRVVDQIPTKGKFPFWLALAGNE